MLATINLHQWVADHRHLLRPPVGNVQIWKDREFIVMVVGGPNQRKDYHVDPGEELFYQLEGDITLRLIEHGQFRELPIRAGEIFLLPPRVPHSPQRGPNTVGLVIERVRQPGEQDGFEWYCDHCGHRLHVATLHITDITTQLKPLFDAFWADERARTCTVCGHMLQP
ncbi:MAG: 3-hydroxyanthranilate 3,4-dioxygenase [Acidobacteriota bacterium]